MDGISEKVFIDINGARQGMFIQSVDPINPVLLYLHGGLPEYFLTRRYPTRLEKHFTVVWWEQRGSGISYNPAARREALTLEQLISDTLEVTHYLQNRFHKEKIYLMAHCGGSFIGMQVVSQAANLYHAYIGMAQMSNQLQSEVLAYEYMLQRFTELGKRSMVRKLEATPVTLKGGIPNAYLALRDKAMHTLGIGTTHAMRSVITGVFLPSLLSRDYSIGEKVKLWRAKARYGVSYLWDTMLATNLSKEVTEVDLPTYFFHGRYDYTVCYGLAKSYFEQLKAPMKGFYTFERSAHSPIFEEPDKISRILLEDVLAGANNLADGKGSHLP